MEEGKKNDAKGISFGEFRKMFREMREKYGRDGKSLPDCCVRMERMCGCMFDDPKKEPSKEK